MPRLKHDDVDALIEEFGAQAILDAVTPLLAETRVQTLEAGLDRKLESLTVVMENLYDPHNGAAAVRSSEAFGLCDLHIIDGSTGTFSVAPDVSVGAHKWIDLHTHASAEQCAQRLKGDGFVLCATVPGADLELEDIPVDRPLAIWFGNERDGLTEAAQALCDHRVSIAMYGFSQSFNLSVSVAIFVHRLAAKRRAHLGCEGDLNMARRDFLRARWRALGIRGLRDVVARSVSA